MNFKPLLDFVGLLLKVFIICSLMMVIGLIGATLVQSFGLYGILENVLPYETIILLFLLLLSFLIVTAIFAALKSKPVERTEEEIGFPSLYEYFSRNLSIIKWGTVTSIASLVGLLPPVILARDTYEYFLGGFHFVKYTTGPFLLRISFVAYVLILISFVIALFRINFRVKKVEKVVKESIRKGSLVNCQDQAYTHLLNKLAERLGVNPPTLWVAKRIERWMPSRSFALAFREEDARIIIDEGYLKSLSKEEVESTFVHELWHLKTEITVSQLMVFDWNSFFYFVGLCMLFMFGILTVIAFLLAGTQSLPYPFSHPLVYASLMMPEIFGIYLFSYAFPDDARLFMFSFLSPDQEEYFADAMSVATVGHPEYMVSALLKTLGLSGIEFLYTGISVEEYRKMLTPTLMSLPRSSVIENELKQACFLKKIFGSQLNIRLGRKLKAFSLFGFFGFSLKFYFSPFARALVQIKKERISTIYNYMRLNSKNFNILECAEETDSTLVETLTVFVCAILGGIIEDITVLNG